MPGVGLPDSTRVRGSGFGCHVVGLEDDSWFGVRGVGLTRWGTGARSGRYAARRGPPAFWCRMFESWFRIPEFRFSIQVVWFRVDWVYGTGLRVCGVGFES